MATDHTPLLIEMNGKISAIGAQLGSIQFQLATDKVAHESVHKDLNSKLERIQKEVDENTEFRKGLATQGKTVKMAYTVIAAIVAFIVGCYTMFGPAIRAMLGLPV